MRYRIRQRRERLRMTQAALAEVAGTPPVYVSLLERGKQTPSWAVKEIRFALVECERSCPKRRHRAAERRIARHRALAEKIAHTLEGRALIEAMKERAWDLMTEGDGSQTDAVLEFIPDAEATALLDEWLDWAMGDNEKPDSTHAEETPPGEGEAAQQGGGAPTHETCGPNGKCVQEDAGSPPA